MRVITRLVMQKRNRERVNVYLDGEFAFGLALQEAVHLQVGQSLTDEQVAELQQADSYQKAYTRALDYLSRRPRSRGELERYLMKKEVAEHHSHQILARLTELGLLDDFAFATYWIENREAFRPRGERAIRYELRQKGVDETIIDQVLAQSELDEVESAYRVALKKMSRLQAIDDPWQFKQKLAGYLGRRGFNWDVIQQVSERLWQEREDDPLAF
ncbi:MAG: RecX family transcriptional regulator [Chloroflexota bacterium]|nr:RecX family transcriptional regulator [Chloroflexota bacterium]